PGAGPAVILSFQPHVERASPRMQRLRPDSAERPGPQPLRVRRPSAGALRPPAHRARVAARQRAERPGVDVALCSRTAPGGNLDRDTWRGHDAAFTRAPAGR